MKEKKIREAVQKKGLVSQIPISHGVGRRKSSVARVWLRHGNGNISVNTKKSSAYFHTDISMRAIFQPFLVTNEEKSFDVEANVRGGGIHSQADAVKLGISRALLRYNEEYRKTLRENGLLTVDSRIKERKKYGQKGARGKFQFVKR